MKICIFIHKNFMLNYRVFIIYSFLFSFFKLWGHTPNTPDNNVVRHGSLQFIENKGQWENKFSFKADIPTGNIFLEAKGITYLFYKEEDLKKIHRHPSPVNSSDGEIILHGHVFKVHFSEANFAKISGSDKYPGIRNYFLGNNPSKWASYVNAYEKINYKEIYPFIDLSIYSYGNDVKYDFIVAPGGNVKDIKLEYEGVDNLYTDNGNLYIITSVNTIIEQKPYAYQVINGNKEYVPCNFKVKNNTLTFDFPSGYNKNHLLVIDPRLIFSSFSGSTADNWGNTATYDKDGNLYAGGIVFGPTSAFSNFPTTTGAFDLSYNGGDVDLAISKYSSDGSVFLYSTYIGGNASEIPHSLITNSKHELFIFGTTASTDFPTSATAYDTTFNGGTLPYPGLNIWPPQEEFPDKVNGIDFPTGSDIFVFKLDSIGANMLASTYIGGSDNDGLNLSDNTATAWLDTLSNNYGDEFRGEIIIDANDNCYIASCTKSSNFPTQNPFQPTYGGGLLDGVVFKLNPDFSSLVWSSYIGGSNSDVAYSLQFDQNNNLYVCGGTSSSNFPVKGTVYQSAFGGFADGFIAHIDNSADTLIRATYTGTAAYDQTYFVQVDTNNDVYILGQTLGNKAATPGVYANANGKQFIQKLNDSLNTEIFYTTFGSGGAEINISPSAFLVNVCQNIFISGWGGAVGRQKGNVFGMPITANAYDNTADINGEFYFMLLGPDATSLLYATYFGGTFGREHVDGGTSRFDPDGIIYQSVCAGCGSSDDFPTTPGVVSTTNNSSNCNNGVIKFDFTELEAIIDTSNLFLCGQGISKFTNNSYGGISYYWNFGDGSDTTVGNQDTIEHFFDTIGVYNIFMVATDLTTCKARDTAYAIINVYPPNVNANAFPDTTICLGENAPLTATGGVTFKWVPSTGLDDSTSSNPIASPDSTTSYTVFITDSNGCPDTAGLTVTLFPSAIADFYFESPIYPVISINQDIPFFNQSINATIFNWDFGDGGSSNLDNPTHKFTQEGIFTVCLTANNTFNCDSVYCLDLEVVKGQVHIPTAFSPNADNENDRFFLKGKGVVNMELRIYNRWGELVYESDDLKEIMDPNRGWNGTYKGKLQEMDVYVYYVRYDLIDGSTDLVEKGNVSLIY